MKKIKFVKYGDTSWRVTNQVELYTQFLKYLSSNQGDLFDDEVFFNISKELGFKTKKKSHVNLLFSQMRRFKLVSKEKKEITLLGKKFIEEINKSPDELDERISSFLLYIDLSWSNWCWLLLTCSYVTENESPFLNLINQAIHSENKCLINKNLLLNWTLGRVLDDLNRPIPTEKIIWEKNPLPNKGSKNYESAINSLNSFIKLSELKRNNNRVGLTEAVQNIINSKNKINKMFKMWFIELNLAKNGTRSKMVSNKINDFIDIIFEMDENEFNSKINELKYIETAKEYINVNRYWINNMNIFYKKNYCPDCGMHLEIDGNIKKIFSFLFDNEIISITNANAITNFIDEEYFCNKIVLDNKSLIDIILEFISSNKKIYQDVKIPYSFEKVIEFFEKYIIEMNNDGSIDVKKREKILKDFNLEGVIFTSVVEYFCNLFIWYKAREYDDKIKDFKYCCNTKLDRDLKPIFTAPGNMPDGFITLQNFDLCIESTLLNKVNDLAKSELTQISKHAANLYIKYNEKNNVILFLAPKIGLDFIRTFLSWHESNIELEFNNTKYKKSDFIPIQFEWIKNLKSFEKLFVQDKSISEIIINIFKCESNNNPLSQDNINKIKEIIIE